MRLLRSWLGGELFNGGLDQRSDTTYLSLANPTGGSIRDRRRCLIIRFIGDYVEHGIECSSLHPSSLTLIHQLMHPMSVSRYSSVQQKQIYSKDKQTTSCDAEDSSPAEDSPLSSFFFLYARSALFHRN